MNSTPAASSARRSAWSFAAVSEVLFSVNSARRIVVTPTAEYRARSSALQRTSARAALSWALVTQYVGGCRQKRGAVGDHWRRQMGRDQHPCRSALSTPHCHG